MKKLLLGIGIMFLLMGTVCAAELVDTFMPPNGYNPMGTSSFIDDVGHNIMMSELDDNTKNLWLQNDSEYLVSKYNDTTWTAVDDENDCYIHEVVEKDGKQYLISSWTPKGVDHTLIIRDKLEEFNKVNDLKPLSIESVI